MFHSLMEFRVSFHLEVSFLTNRIKTRKDRYFRLPKPRGRRKPESDALTYHRRRAKSFGLQNASTDIDHRPLGGGYPVIVVR